MEECILKKLIKMGLSAEAIQRAYERYKWHIEYFPSKIEALEKENSKLKQTCGSCKHIDLDNDQEPCCFCSHTCTNYWEPKIKK